MHEDLILNIYVVAENMRIIRDIMLKEGILLEENSYRHSFFPFFFVFMSSLKSLRNNAKGKTYTLAIRRMIL